MSKRYFPITILTAVLLLVALFGYLRIVPAQDNPTRVVLDNPGGRVLFSHQHHAEDLGLDCADCHHDGGSPRLPEACGSCHPAVFDKNYAQAHVKTFKGSTACSRCHTQPPTPGGVFTDRPDVSALPLRTEAFHRQCMDCHERSGVGPYGKDSCQACHQQRK